jgi:hypothetical protein
MWVAPGIRPRQAQVGNGQPFLNPGSHFFYLAEMLRLVQPL